MIAGMSYYQICWFFLIYAFIGWVVEVIYHAVTYGEVVNRGFINGPLCPVYGFGALAVFSAVNTVAARLAPAGSGDLLKAEDINVWLVFIIGMVLTTAVELIAGWALDILFHARWWDYSKKPFNFRGYICLEFSIIWGMGIVFVVRVVHPTIRSYSVAAIDQRYGWPLLAVLYVIFAVDVGISAAVANGLNKKLKEIDQMRNSLRTFSNAMSKRIGENAIYTSQRFGEGQVQAALAKAELRDAVRKKRGEYASAAARYKRGLQAGQVRWKAVPGRKEMEERLSGLLRVLSGNRVFGYGRLLRAFPDMKHGDYSDLVESILRTIPGYHKQDEAGEAHEDS
jgi:uncharacterized membrane protein